MFEGQTGMAPTLLEGLSINLLLVEKVGIFHQCLLIQSLLLQLAVIMIELTHLLESLSSIRLLTEFTTLALGFDGPGRTTFNAWSVYRLM
jgi:hypothetical protein